MEDLHLIDNFDIHYVDKQYIINFLKRKFNCDVEYGKFKYSIDNAKKIYCNKYYFCLKFKFHKDSFFKDLKNYKYYTTSQVLNFLINNEEYVQKFKSRHNHILKSYENEMIEYVKQKMVYYKLLYPNSTLEIDSNYIAIKISNIHSHRFYCHYNLYSFRQLKDFFKDMIHKELNQNL